MCWLLSWWYAAVSWDELRAPGALSRSPPIPEPSMAMDAITLVAYTFEIGSAVVERCELVKQCHSESSRIAVRTLRVLACLEDASKQFSSRVEFETSLMELKKALEEARDLVTRCQKAKGVSAKIGALMRANTLKEGLVRVESDLQRVAADMQLPMLTDIRRAVECISERESETSGGADGGIDAEMLEQAVRDAVRKELNATTTVPGNSGEDRGGGRMVDEIIRDNLSKLYEAEAAVAADEGAPSSTETVGERPLLCTGHKEECALRTVKKGVSWDMHVTVCRRNFCSTKDLSERKNDRCICWWKVASFVTAFSDASRRSITLWPPTSDAM